MRPPVLRLHGEELIVDNFAGGGGASLGIEWATGRSPDIAINHNAVALAIHKEEQQVDACGNAVPPRMAEALVRAQFSEQEEAALG